MRIRFFAIRAAISSKALVAKLTKAEVLGFQINVRLVQLEEEHAGHSRNSVAKEQ